MLSDRERGILASIERDLVTSDPHFARRFQVLAMARPRRPLAPSGIRGAGPAPFVLLITGLTLLVLGGVTATLPIVGTGVVLALLALVMASLITAPRPGPA
ncbi:DUF3040 domain-containing protein [Pseudonocardia asaccharolytica]|uniref:DUF3040 domain-containing protein n=1 Tax=Pseudonocardia asaccharolytica DSM 44247 = NBRC 16224 TaxID=1123024 RepID=A0A511D3L1_9PSEU|nr:DUF3040 domain-containing protein [Pseudonocardia asaccharolytica]GEL19371.1 hypothetical protein PA7_32080 [Pseudonocardia asaccharolytica DSM 44247 = NBRC 16224]